MENKTAVITGATSGIGAAYAARFAEEGHDLVITGRRKKKIEAFADKIKEEHGVNVEVVLAELSTEEGLQTLVDIISNRQIEILVNNAGFGVNSLYQECDLKAMEQMAKVNVLVPMKLIRIVLPGMVERRKGTIINVSSESAFLIIPKNSVYSGGKAFLKSFTEGLHLDLMNTGVKVQAVCPGFTRTDFHEKMGMNKSRQKNKGLMKWMSPEEVVDISLKDLEKNKVICIPGIHTKLLIRLLNLFPKNAYYKFAYDFSRKNSGKQPN
jgi:short-subunit dehydrogenase